jgi:hypothetical protein
LIFINELKKATKATEAMPAEILSAIITIIKYEILGSRRESKANNIFVAAARTAPSNNTE